MEKEPIGGWFCYGRCRSFTELNCDREENVCARCHQPTVQLLPHSQGEEVTHANNPPPPPRRFRYEHGRIVSVEEGHKKFEAMRAAINPQP